MFQNFLVVYVVASVKPIITTGFYTESHKRQFDLKLINDIQ